MHALENEFKELRFLLNYITTFQENINIEDISTW